MTNAPGHAVISAWVADEYGAANGRRSTKLTRVLRLTPLAPEIVDAILDGHEPEEMPLDELLDGFPVEWDRQPTILQGL